MRRFFRSAAFPILIVIVLAFFAQRLLHDSSAPKPPTLSEFLTQVKQEPSSFDEVTFQPKSNTIDVKPKTESSYSIGYPNNYEPELVKTLQRKGVPFNA